MTRKDYIVIATALRESIDKAHDRGGYKSRIEAEAVACNVADHLADSYPNFHAARFLDACGVEGS